jgi:hypothetical protein
MTVQKYNDAVTPQKLPYQDPITYPCFPNPVNSDGSEKTSSQVPTIEDFLQRIIDIMGGGDVGGAYKATYLTIPAGEQRYEIPLGIYATQLNIRCDQDVQMIFNNKQFDTIILEIGDFPLVISDLKRSESIHTIYVTTTVETELQILAFGSVK